MHRLICLLAVLAGTLCAADITGTWYFAVELPLGSGAPTFELKQQGNKVTGTYTGTLGNAPVTGAVDGNKIELTFEAEAAGQKVKATYKGTIKNDKEMAGTVSYTEIGDGTFTAKKK